MPSTRSVRQPTSWRRAGALDIAEAALFAAVERGEPWAVQFLLRGPGRTRGYGEKYEVVADVTVKDETPRSLEIDYDDFNRRTTQALRLLARVERGEPADPEDEDDAPDDDGDDVA
jgi:hypothetical protein